MLVCFRNVFSSSLLSATTVRSSSCNIFLCMFLAARAVVDQAQHVIRKVVLNKVFLILVSWIRMLANVVVERRYTSAVGSSIKDGKYS